MTKHQASASTWQSGDVVVRREVLNDGRVWLELPVIVVQDDPGLLATYIAEGAPLRFPPGDWPTADGLHPWHTHSSWEDHGVLMLQRPDEAYAVWVFWSGPNRDFDCWYINLQQPFRRTAMGYDTQDLELDIVVAADLSWRLKDDEVLEQRVREGRYTADQVVAARAEALRVTDELDAGRKWWSDDWARWRPDPKWPRPAFPARAGTS